MDDQPTSTWLPDEARSEDEQARGETAEEAAIAFEQTPPSLEVESDDMPHHVSGHMISGDHSFHLVADDDPEVLEEIAEHDHEHEHVS